jgi:hypothetical protein
MAFNNDTETMATNRAESASTKRRSVSKAVGNSIKNAVKKATTTSLETVFKDEPNPYKTPIPPYIWIDHPTQGEKLSAPTYVIRLGVGGADTVEISIDKSPWQPCRLASGYWWFDWSAIKSGKHTLVARMRTTDGRWFKTPPRTCDYRP